MRFVALPLFQSADHERGGDEEPGGFHPGRSGEIQFSGGPQRDARWDLWLSHGDLWIDNDG